MVMGVILHAHPVVNSTFNVLLTVRLQQYITRVRPLVCRNSINKHLLWKK